MSELATTIVVSVVTNGTVLGLFIWVFKKLFETALQKRSEAYRAEIDLINKKNFHQYSRVFDLQAETIASVYANLSGIAQEVEYLAFTFHFQEKHPELFQISALPEDGNPREWKRFFEVGLAEKERFAKAEELSDRAIKSLHQFRAKRIYFRESVANEIERYLVLAHQVGSGFANVAYRDPDENEPVVSEEVINIWKQAASTSNELFPELEGEFRKHLGIANENA